jgi:hypothetical protein
MIKRIVKMSFHPELVDTFLMEVFETSKRKIRAFPGCHRMELLRDTHQPNVLFTLSIWENEAALDTYRHSELFQDTWAKTKVLFNDRPQAWSTDVIDIPD